MFGVTGINRVSADSELSAFVTVAGKDSSVEHTGRYLLRVTKIDNLLAAI